MLKIKQSRDRLIFLMGIPIPGNDGLYIEMGPWLPTQILSTFINPDHNDLSIKEQLEKALSLWDNDKPSMMQSFANIGLY